MAVAFPVVAAADGEPKTLGRGLDPVVVRTGDLEALGERRTERLSLLRFEDGGWAPIPFQVDPMDADGQPILPAAAEPVFGAGDELVFMAGDSGDRAPDEAFDETWEAAVEIEVRDPLDGGRGWVYLASSARPLRSPQRYVHYDERLHRASSDHYEVDYAVGHNFLTALRVLPAAGGSGENLLRGTRMHGQPRFFLLLGHWSPEFTERTSLVEVEGVRNGPVRAIRRVRLSVDLGPLLPELPSGTVHTSHYRAAFDSPTRFSVPWMALKSLREFRFENMVDFRPEAAPERYWDTANPEGLTFGGEASQDVVADVDHEWWAAGGETGAFLQALVIPDAWRNWGVARGTVFQDGAADGAEPARRAAGFSLLHMTRLREAGVYWLRQATVVLPHGRRPGDERAALAMLHHPLEARVRGVRGVALAGHPGRSASGAPAAQPQ